MKIFNILPDFAPDSKSKVWFYMPDSTVIRSGNPFYIPDFDDCFHLYPALAVKISRLGKNIAPRFSHRYYSEITPAATVRAINLLHRLQRNGLPWTKAVNFDKSCFIGEFIDVATLTDDSVICFNLGSDNTQYDLSGLLQTIDEVISEISSDNILKMGDIVLIPLSAEGLPLTEGQFLKASVNNAHLLEIRIK